MRAALENWNYGILTEGRKISYLRYLDDITLIASDAENMTELISPVKTVTKKQDRAKYLPVSTALAE